MIRATGNRRGFTLIELLVVIAIIAILIGLLLPAVQKVRDAAARMACSSNIKQIALATHTYHDATGYLPVCGPSLQSVNPTYDGNGNNWSWLARILPYVEQGNLYTAGGIPDSLFNAANARTAMATKVPTFFCPSDDASGQLFTDRNNTSGIAMAGTNYKGVAGNNWAWSSNAAWNFTAPAPYGNNGLDTGNGILYRTNYLKPIKIPSITDGTSNTAMVGEDIPSMDNHCAWPFFNYSTGTMAIPLNNNRNASGAPYATNDWGNVYSFRSKHTSGANFAMADGSVRFISNSIDLVLYRALASKDGGEVASAP